MKKLLLTGFEAFLTNTKNPTEELVMKFHKAKINGYSIYSHVLPVEYERAEKETRELIRDLKPDLIISLGLASKRAKITPELIAINYAHCNDADNAGVIKQYEKIIQCSNNSYVSTLPIEEIITSLNIHQFDSELSTDAGSYVCNTVMYSALDEINILNLNIPCGFIHIPSTFTLKNLELALSVIIKTFK